MDIGRPIEGVSVSHSLRVTASLAVLLFLVSQSPTAAPAAGTTQPVALIALHMVSPRIGWGLETHAVVRTLDGGKHWTTVRGFPRSVSLTGTAISTYGLNVAWLISSFAYTADIPRSTVLSTHDGGRTWRRSNPIRGWASSSSDYSWITGQRGWVLTSEGGAAGSVPTNVYRTSDGGVHWHLVSYNHLTNHSPQSLPSCDGFDGISFRTRTMGWATGMCGAAPQILMLYRTLDAGRTWRQQQIPLPQRRVAGLQLIPPHFFGQNGLLPAGPIPSGMPALYVTSNGGATWHRTSPVPTREVGVPHVSSLDAQHVWLHSNRTLYFTADEGRHWTVRSHTLSMSSSFDFVTPRIGFALSQSTARHTAFLLRTTDGGRTWHPVNTSAQ
jgi:photosystem II stability/assembly factor-like uncharacterized protein